METIYYPLPKRYDTKEGNPLYGKVEYRDPISSTLLETYTLDKVSGYKPGRNPVYTDNYGLVEQVFTANTLVLCCLYSYIGNYSDPTVDQRAESWKHEYDFYASFNNEQPEARNYYEGINGLINAPITEGYVTVVGYYNKYDCQSRTYVWDPTATDDEDGGYVIKSLHSETGRWILVWNQESLPSEIYGVTTSNTTNLNRLLQYPASVGTNHIPTCRQIEFTNFKMPNDYAYTLTTTKSVKCSRDCYFGKGQFKVDDVEVIGNGTGILGNFYITNPKNTTQVLLSWYSSAQYFFWSNANKLIYDDKDKLTQNAITSDTTITGCTLEFTRDWSTTLIAKLTLDNVHLIMSPTFYWGEGNTEKLYFKNMTVNTNWCRKLKVSHCDNCRVDIFNEFDYDLTTSSTNNIHTHSGAFVHNISSPFSYLDMDWFCEVADYTINNPLKFHGVANTKPLVYASNLNNADISDCHTIDFFGFPEGNQFSLDNGNSDTGNSDIRVINANNVIFSIAAKASDTHKITFENSKFSIKKIHKLVAQKQILIIKDSTFTLTGSAYWDEDDVWRYSGVEVLGGSVKFENSRILDERTYGSESASGGKAGLPRITVDNLEFYNSEVTYAEGFECNGALKAYNTTFNGINTTFNSEMFPHGETIVDGCYLYRTNLLFKGDADETHTVTYTNNTLKTAQIGWAYKSSYTTGFDSDNCVGVAVGNKLFSTSSIVLDADATPGHYRIEDNAGWQKTTKPPCFTFYGDRAAYKFNLLSEGAQKQKLAVNYQRLYSDTADDTSQTKCTGRAEYVYNWLYNNSFFIPAKSAGKSYDDMINTIIINGFVDIVEWQSPYLYANGSHGSTNYMYTCNNISILPAGNNSNY